MTSEAQREPPPELTAEEGVAFQALLGTAAHVERDEQMPYVWVDQCMKSERRVVAMALASVGNFPLRDAGRAAIDTVLTKQMIRAMRRLERVGIFVGVVGLVVAVPSGVIAVLELSRLFG